MPSQKVDVIGMSVLRPSLDPKHTLLFLRLGRAAMVKILKSSYY